MTETKTTSHAHTAKKNPAEALADLAPLGKKAFMAYVEAGSEVAATLDKVARAQAGHAATFGREAGEAYTAMLESGLKARETARKVAVEMLEAAIPAGR